MAGLALSNARLGVIHGMAHPIGVRFGVPHGLVCGVLLPAALEFVRPAALEFVRPAAPEKFARLASLLGGDPAAYARGLLSACDLPARLTEYGLRADAFERIAEESLASGSTKATPRPVTKENILALVRAIA
jgi:alcohol dehydrogenase